jgi:hypothetical protein
MKLAVGFLLVLFITYLSTPSIVSIIDSGIDLTIDFGSIDEDESDILKITLKSFPFVFFSGETATYGTNIYFRNVLKHSFLSDSIFIPPPEQVQLKFI